MEKLSPPSDTALKVFRACVSKVEDNHLKSRLESIEQDIVAAALSYKGRGKRGTLFRFPSQLDVRGIVTKKEMSDVYNYRMAKKESPGRYYYDRLKAAPDHGRCPLCALRDVKTLDHYLSQKDFPILAIVPVNLIPACFECNKGKGMKRAGTAAEQFLHPYFDDINRAQWLKAKVQETSPGALHYFVNGPKSWDNDKLQRVQFHFDTLDIQKLYSSHAAQEIIGNRREFIRLLNQYGALGVRRHLNRQRDTWAAEHRNSWKTVMFATLAASDWFCNGGFR